MSFDPPDYWGISPYGKDRLRPNEKRIAKDLLERIKKAKNLSNKFKENFEVSVSAKYQKPTIIVPKTNDKELGIFEYEYLSHWAEDNHVGWDWDVERDDYIVIFWRAE